jgi:glucokinase
MKYAIGIDIGATKIKGVITDNKGKIKLRREILTKAERGKTAILNDILGIINYLKKTANANYWKLAGIGVGAPGVIKNKRLVFGGGTLSQLMGLNLAKVVQKKTGLKTFADNDSKLFALAESRFGAGKNYNRVAGIIWGTGIGSGIIDKKNRNRVSVEIGHLVVEPNIKTEPKCGCGARGCVENLASGKNIIRRYYARGGKIKNAGVREIYFSKEKIAKEVLEDAYRYLGMGIAVLVVATKTDIVVLGGGVSNLSQAAHRRLREYAREFLPRNLKKIKIVKSKLGNFSGALGAAMLIFAGE